MALLSTNFTYQNQSGSTTTVNLRQLWQDQVTAMGLKYRVEFGPSGSNPALIPSTGVSFTTYTTGTTGIVGYRDANGYQVVSNLPIWMDAHASYCLYSDRQPCMNDSLVWDADKTGNDTPAEEIAWQGLAQATTAIQAGIPDLVTWAARNRLNYVFSWTGAGSSTAETTSAGMSVRSMSKDEDPANGNNAGELHNHVVSKKSSTYAALSAHMMAAGYLSPAIDKSLFTTTRLSIMDKALEATFNYTDTNGTKHSVLSTYNGVERFDFTGWPSGYIGDCRWDSSWYPFCNWTGDRANITERGDTASQIDLYRSWVLWYFYKGIDETRATEWYNRLDGTIYNDLSSHVNTLDPDRVWYTKDEQGKIYDECGVDPWTNQGNACVLARRYEYERLRWIKDIGQFAFFANLFSNDAYDLLIGQRSNVNIQAKVCYDSNQNGTCDGGEQVLPNVSVYFYKDRTMDGLTADDDFGWNPVNTDANGIATFAWHNMPAGRYYVKVDITDPDLQGHTTPTGPHPRAYEIYPPISYNNPGVLQLGFR
jgi:hypothetical protein